MYSKHRIEALSDGIFAIVMTLLVLELKVPVAFEPGHLWEALRQDPESWIGFLITFGIAARYWMLQHRVFELSERFPQQALVITFIFLGGVAVLPFSTALFGRHASEPIALLVYCINQAIIGVALIVKLEYLRIHDHLPTTRSLWQLRLRLWSLTSVMVIVAIESRFLPLKYIYILPAIVIMVARFFAKRAKETGPQLGGSERAITHSLPK